MIFRRLVILFVLLTAQHGGAAMASVYQWSVPVPAAASAASQPESPAITPRAFLWIPVDCQHVRAVVFGQHNMLEEDILDDERFRSAMAKLGFAIVWVSPAMDNRWDPARSGPRFNSLMKSLADASGYAEVVTAPVIPIGHSACASFPWNFAASNPQRTLAILSIHGDAPRTPLAGFGLQHVTWPDGLIDGIPGLMAMGEFEWSDDRLTPALAFRSQNPRSPIAMLAEPGAGHFAAADTLVPFLTMFLEKVAAARLPGEAPPNTPAKLEPVDPSAGWLVQRWTPSIARTIAPAPFDKYSGDPSQAFWAIDAEMAQAIQNYRADQVGKKPQLIGFTQDGALVHPAPTQAMDTLKFEPRNDGVTFEIEPRFLDTVSDMGPGHAGPDGNNHVRWSHLPPGSPIGHVPGGQIAVHRIEGPVREIGSNLFELSFERGTGEKPAIWLAATSPGDDTYASMVQQLLIDVPRNKTGDPQTLAFDPIADVAKGTSSIRLKARSSAGLPVRFFVREGPAEIDGNTLSIVPSPPRAKFPMRITVVAWQWGRSASPPIQSATAIEQSFQIMESK